MRTLARPGWTLTGLWSQNPRVLLELSDADLETAARACRAFAYRQGEDAKKIENPTMRGPIERSAQRAAALAERFGAARKAVASKAR